MERLPDLQPELIGLTNVPGKGSYEVGPGFVPRLRRRRLDRRSSHEVVSSARPSLVCQHSHPCVTLLSAHLPTGFLSVYIMYRAAPRVDIELG